MKIDLIKMLRENELFQEALKNIPVNERDAARYKIESMISDISKGFNQFNEKLQNLDQETLKQIQQSVNNDRQLVINENQTNVDSTDEVDG